MFDVRSNRFEVRLKIGSRMRWFVCWPDAMLLATCCWPDSTMPTIRCWPDSMRSRMLASSASFDARASLRHDLDAAKDAVDLVAMLGEEGGTRKRRHGGEHEDRRVKGECIHVEGDDEMAQAARGDERDQQRRAATKNVHHLGIVVHTQQKAGRHAGARELGDDDG